MLNTWDVLNEEWKSPCKNCGKYWPPIGGDCDGDPNDICSCCGDKDMIVGFGYLIFSSENEINCNIRTK